MQLKASAPGSLMLLGEYAVLSGKPALVCAVDKRITVTLTPRVDKQIEIHSDLHGHFSTDLVALTIEKPFQFVLAALKYYQAKLKQGCDISIVSEFSDKVGLGSSAAVTVATLAAIISWINIRVAPLELVHQGRQVIRSVQGVGSGADIAAAVYGGLVGYHTQPLLAEKFPVICPLTVMYTGFKTPTVDAIKRVQTYFSTYSQLFRHLNNSIGQCAIEGIQLARKEEWNKLGEIMTIQQGLMESLGVSTVLLQDIISDLRKQQGILGAKISGSGLGDCVVGLGALPESYTYHGSSHGVQRIPVAMTLQGVHCEKN
ncbi:MAG: mevalonate kinase [Gammaproteobacteria bacterium]|nr:mevalonate kinase [Gammaproteobacteria bacterium]